ncbi:SpoIIE family protein phosphatase [Yinghuangia seranimata]|uniref:SpoIIE family protein phosphatase n=1 Tax=Yinghuangia seranimata TaxID=408067 RepID=UPI00248C75A7|nr:SpoIIE family protein phosphatase [Yinghuangia seranimata]MDI2130921.1 SpoIIE family protein phosphatase [Yinghuangia seranimata]
MRSRGVIEQAKGLLMARLGCGPDEAFRQLSEMSQQANMKLVEIAAGLLGAAAPPEPALSGEEAGRVHLAASELATASSADDVARLCAESAPGTASAVVLASLEPDGALALVGTHGVPAQRVSQWQRIPPQARMPLTDAVRHGRAVWFRDRASFTASYPHLAAPLLPGESVCAVPLTDEDGTTHGALAVAWPGPVPQDAADPAGQDAYVHALAGLAGRALRRLTASAEQRPGGLRGGALWFRAVLDGLMDAVLILTPVRAREDAPDGPDHVVDFRVVFANSATVDLAGRTGEDLVGRRMTELYPGMVVSGVFDRVLEAHTTGLPYAGDAEQFTEVVAGALRASTMTLRAAPFLDGVLLTWRLHDEDERQAAQLAQAQRLARLGTWQFDVGTGDAVCSPEVAAILGLTAGGVLEPTAVEAVIDTDDRPAVRAALAEIMREHRPQTVEFRVRGAEGQRSVLAAAEAVCGPGGAEVIALRGVLQDVSDRHHAQAALADARDRLAEERARTAAQHEAVRRLQSAILGTPDSAPGGLSHETRPGDPRLRVATRYVPARTDAQVGGDWYDAIGLPGGSTLIAIGDVSGHGMPAAAGMAQLRHALRGMAYTGAEPAQVLTWLNQMICHQQADYIATAICARLNPATWSLTWAQAGHLPPLLVRDRVPRVLQPPYGMVLGAAPEAAYAAGVLELAPGDVVLMYTDGLVAHRREDVGRGMSHLVRAVREYEDDDLDGLVDHVMRRSGAPNPRDDTCLVGIQVPRTAARGPHGSS